jgi:hypothetical protein
MTTLLRGLGVVLLASWLGMPASAKEPPLPSWNDGAAKSAIVEFVEAVTTDGGPDFVPPNERIAVFDNDGTLWAEMGPGGKPDHSIALARGSNGTIAPSVAADIKKRRAIDFVQA